MAVQIESGSTHDSRNEDEYAERGADIRVCTITCHHDRARHQSHAGGMSANPPELRDDGLDENNERHAEHQVNDPNRHRVAEQQIRAIEITASDTEVWH